VTVHSLLTTKISAPVRNDLNIQRERLTSMLERSLQHRVTSLCAPAGYGKTTAVVHWLHARSLRAAWVQIDEPDNDLIRFWSYVVFALERSHAPGLHEQLAPLLHAAMGVSIHTVIDVLLTELTGVAGEIVLVLDDYHRIRNEAVHDSLAYFLEHAAPLHAIIASRSELPLPVGKWSVLGLLHELDARSLLFTRQEADAYYTSAAPFRLTADQAAALLEVTEGWPAGLQLASISLARSQDPERLLREISGAHGRIADYLLQEVFAGLPDDLRRFMLQTCVLNRMDAAICDRLTGRGDSRHMLERMRRMNLFLIPIGEQSDWYRYHHLIAEFLLSQASRLHPESLDALHREASAAFAERGMADEAIEHALLAGQYPAAIALITAHMSSFLARGEMGTLLRFFGTIAPVHPLPPLLTLLHAFALSAIGMHDPAEAIVAEFERELERMAPGDDRESWRSGLFFVKGNMLVNAGRYKEWFEHTGTAGHELPENPFFFAFNYNTTDPFIRRTPFGLKGVLNEDTERIGRRISLVLEEHGWKDSLMNHYVVQSLGEGYYEWNRLEEAAELLKLAEAAGRRKATAGLLVPSLLMQAKLRLAERHYSAALQLADDAVHAVQELREFHWLGHLRAFRALIEIRAGRLAEAEMTLSVLRLPDQSRPTLDKELAFAVSARLLALRGKEEQALRLLEAMKLLSEREGIICSLAEIAVLQALIHQRLGQPEAACRHLRAALKIGEANGYIRTFLDEGEAMAELLKLYTSRQGAYPELTEADARLQAYASKLLLLYPDHGSTARKIADGGALAELLTPKELEIMQGVMQGLANRQIADALSITVGTVKIHLNRIYSKLEVKSRTQAVLRCRELGWQATVGGSAAEGRI